MNNRMIYRAKLAEYEQAATVRNPASAELPLATARLKACPPLSRDREYWGRVEALVRGGTRLAKAKDAAAYAMNYRPEGE